MENKLGSYINNLMNTIRDTEEKSFLRALALDELKKLNDDISQFTFLHTEDVETLPDGKFYPDLEDDYNKSIRDAAKTQTATQVTTAVTDLLQAYISSGGLTAEPGEWDPTTYGSGDAEWSWLGRGTPEETEIIQVSDLTDEGERYMREGVRTITEQSEDYVPSAFGDDFIRKRQDFGDMVISGAGTILDLVRRN